jgi:hypothetical protein
MKLTSSNPKRTITIEGKPDPSSTELIISEGTYRVVVHVSDEALESPENRKRIVREMECRLDMFISIEKGHIPRLGKEVPRCRL